MKRLLLFGLMTAFMTNALQAQNPTSATIRTVVGPQSKAVENFIKKHEEQGRYVEMSEDYIKAMLTTPHAKLTSPSGKGVLQLFRSLTVSAQYWDELRKNIEADNYQRESYSRTMASEPNPELETEAAQRGLMRREITRKIEMVSAQYTRQSADVAECVLIRKNPEELSVIYMKGTNMNLVDFTSYLSFFRNNAPSQYKPDARFR